jgi:hypothetical protein
LRITALAGDAGPKVELLEYLAPADGRPYPPDARANDLLHWQTRVVVQDLSAALAAVRGSGHRLISPGIVTIGEPELTRALGLEAVLNVRDPDGHAIALSGILDGQGQESTHAQ